MQTTNWENIFYRCDNELISLINKEIIQINRKMLKLQ